MNNMHSSFLKEMGITEWTSREAAPLGSVNLIPNSSNAPKTPERPPLGQWWFFGVRPQGDAQTLFNNLIRVLGLSSSEWVWKSPEDNLPNMKVPDNGLPVVAFSFGGSSTHKITGERDPLPQLRETILALNCGTDEDIPVIASFDLAHVVSSPKDKVLLWQDLLLAKSVLQSI